MMESPGKPFNPLTLGQAQQSGTVVLILLPVASANDEVQVHLERIRAHVVENLFPISQPVVDVLDNRREILPLREALAQDIVSRAAVPEAVEPVQTKAGTRNEVGVAL